MQTGTKGSEIEAEGTQKGCGTELGMSQEVSQALDTTASGGPK